MIQILTPFLIALAGGIGFLAFTHYKQFEELAKAIYFIVTVVLVLSFAIDSTIDAVVLELKYEINSDKRDEAMLPVEGWQRFWFLTGVFSLIALAYTFIVHSIAYSVNEERKSKDEKIDNDVNQDSNGEEVAGGD